MIDPILLLLVGAIIFALGFMFGNSARREVRRAEAKAIDTSLKPICLCEHAISFHKDGGKCQQEVYDSKGYSDGKCRCTKYVGPQILDNLFMPPVIPLAVESQERENS